MRSRRLGCLAGVIVVVAMLVIGCESSEDEAPAIDPSTNWYGDIVGEQSYGLIEDELTSDGLGRNTLDVTHRVTFHLHISKEGVRRSTAKATSHTYSTSTHTSQSPCPLYTRATSTIDGQAPEKEIPKQPGDGAGHYLYLPLTDRKYTGVDSIGARVTFPTETHGHNDVESCDTAKSDPYDSTSEASIDASWPLARMTGTLTDDKSAVGETTWREGDTTTYQLRWSLKRAKDLEADVGGPYSVERGSTVQLDGSRSRGDITKYLWTVKPEEADCKGDSASGVNFIGAGKEATHEGQTFTFTALCNVEVKLVVTGRNGDEDTDDSGEVSVRARDFETADEDPVVENVDINSADGGRNQCAYEPATKPSKDFLHRDGDGFTVSRVAGDEGGPFAGAFYIAGVDLKVKRREAREAAYIGPTGGIFIGTGAPFNAQLQSQIAAHEKAHTTLIRNALQNLKRSKRDPAVLIEKLASYDETAIRAAAGVTISDANEVLCRATQHPYVFPMLGQFAGISGTIKDSSGNVVANVANLQTFANDNLVCH